MRYTVTKNIIQVIGKIWMPAITCAEELTLSDYDMGNLAEEDGTITRELVESWLTTHSGDFQSVEDFRADFDWHNKHFESDWQSEDSEYTFNDCMYPHED